MAEVLSEMPINVLADDDSFFRLADGNIELLSCATKAGSEKEEDENFSHGVVNIRFHAKVIRLKNIF